MKHFNLKKCSTDMGCWSGLAGVLGVVFIVVATILTLLTMNGLGILGMFIVGVLLCRRKMVICPCCDTHCDEDGECTVEHTPKAKPKAKKEAVKK